MRRVGIKTVGRGMLLTNYGSFFQHFALRKFIRSLGMVPYRLEAKDNWKMELFDWVLPLRVLRIKLLNFFGVRKGIVDSVTFGDVIGRWGFIRDYKHLIGDLFEKSSAEDVAYVAGGDSIWFGKDRSNFLLDVPVGRKKISYAPSSAWDVVEHDVQWRALLRESVKTFAAISVRERAGFHICREVVQSPNIVQVVDPVFFLGKRDVEDIAIGKSIFNKDTVLGYFVNVYCPEALNILTLQKVANGLSADLKIIGIQNAGVYVPRGNRFHASPRKFLRAFMEAKWIVTNSFHGIVFALIMRKPFVFMEQKSLRYGDQNLRQREVLETYALEDRRVPFNVESDKLLSLLNNPIDYSRVSAMIDTNVLFSQRWLRSALEVDDKN